LDRRFVSEVRGPRQERDRCVAACRDDLARARRAISSCRLVATERLGNEEFAGGDIECGEGEAVIGARHGHEENFFLRRWSTISSPTVPGVMTRTDLARHQTFRH